MPENEIHFIIASSVTAHLPEAQRFGLKETIDIAKGKASGVQLYINPARKPMTTEDITFLREQLRGSELTTNVVHLPGYLIPTDLQGVAGDALKITSELLDPIPEVGKVAVIHHLPYSGYNDEEIVAATQEALQAVGDTQITLGFEHYHPPQETNQGNIPEQVDMYLSLLRRLQESGVPTIGVIDIGRFHTLNANNGGKPLTDPDFALIRKVCEALKGQKVLLHLADYRDNKMKFSTPGNAVPVGTQGILTPAYKELARLGREHDIAWIGEVDETEDINAISNKDIVTSLFTERESADQQ